MMVFLGRVYLVGIFFSFSTLNISCHLLLVCKFLLKKSASNIVGIPLYLTSCFSLFAFKILSLLFVVVQSLSYIQVFVTSRTAAHLGFPVPHSLPEFAEIHVHCVNDAIQTSHSVSPFSSCSQSFSA